MSMANTALSTVSGLSAETWELRVCGPVGEAYGDDVAPWAAGVLAGWVAGWDCTPRPAALVVATPAAALAETIGAELESIGPCTVLVGAGAEEAFELARLLAVAADSFALGVADDALGSASSLASSGTDAPDDDGPVLVVVLDPARRADATPDAREWELTAALV